MRSSPFALLDARLASPPDPARVSPLLARDYAHRGLHHRDTPENSLAAARAAIGAGLGIECDVRRLRDGEVVVFHDIETDRLLGVPGRIDALDRKALDALSLPDGERVPSLAALLATVAGRVPVLIEVKPDTRIAALCLGVRRALEGYRGIAAVMSFDPAVPRWFADQAPGILRGLVVTERRGMRAAIRRRHAIWRARPQFLAWDVRCLPSRLPAALRAGGLPVLAWTVRDEATRATAAAHADRPILERS